MLPSKEDTRTALQLVKLQASEDSTANSTRGRVEEPEAASYKLQA